MHTAFFKFVSAASSLLLATFFMTSVFAQQHSPTNSLAGAELPITPLAQAVGIAKLPDQTQSQSVTAWSVSPNPANVGYYLYAGPSSGIYTTKIDLGNISLFFRMSSLAPAFYKIVAYDNQGVETKHSNEFPLPAAPVEKNSTLAIKKTLVNGQQTVTIVVNGAPSTMFRIEENSDLKNKNGWTPVTSINTGPTGIKEHVVQVGSGNKFYRTVFLPE